MTMLLKPLGDERTANSITAGQQSAQKIAALPSGGYVVVWMGEYSDGDAYGIDAQLFDADGGKIGGQIKVNQLGESLQLYPTVTALASGGFVVTWTHYADSVAGGGDGSGNAVKARVFDAAGAPIGPDFLVNTNVSNDQKDATVAALPGGGFVIGWTDTGQPQGGDALRAQRFDASGAKVGAEFAINTLALTAFVQPDLEVVALSGGNFVFAWTHLHRGPPDQIQVKAQMFDSAGNRIGAEFLVPASTAPGSNPDLAALPNGGFVVGWLGYDRDLDMSVARAQMFDSAGAKVGPEVTASNPENHINSISVAALAGGGFLVGWVDSAAPGSREGSIRGQMYDSAGNRVGSQLQMSTAPVDSIFSYPDLATLSSGRIVAAWNAESQTTFNDVKMQLFRAPLIGTPLADSIDGTSEGDGIAGLGSDDMLDGKEGDDSLEGGAGADRLTGGLGNDVVDGGSGNDVLRLYDGGDDTVLGGDGMDNIFFGGTLNAADMVDGGEGIDTLVLQGPYGSLTLTANIVRIENISILAGSNTAFGEPGTNRYDYVLTTNNANFAAGVQARINGAALLEGEDFTFDGSAETDASFVVYGGKGKDTLTGGLGNDIFFYAEERFASGDTVNGGAGYDGMFLRGNYTIDFNAPGYTGLFTNIENLTLTSATDERYARGGGTEFDYNLTLSNAIVKPGETLTVSGALLMMTETMILDASQEADGFLRLFGGKANDTLKGGGQADLLLGNLGADMLTGNGGADTFRFDSTAESNSGSMDQILDFTPGTDKIDLGRIDANSLVAGDQAFSWIGTGAFTGTAGELRAENLAGLGWTLMGDTNGDGRPEFLVQLTLQGPTPLSAADFLL
jgi:Ca2+-binding RTX toxin-like protein